MVSEKSKYIHKSHNVSVLIYHLVCTAKYRRVVFSNNADAQLKHICLEIGTDNNHVHFLIQTVPTYSPTKIVRTIKSITAKEIFKTHPEVKKQLWGGEFWGKGYFINTVGQHGTESMIAKYVQNQGDQDAYVKLHSEKLHLKLF